MLGKVDFIDAGNGDDIPSSIAMKHLIKCGQAADIDRLLDGGKANGGGNEEEVFSCDAGQDVVFRCDESVSFDSKEI